MYQLVITFDVDDNLYEDDPGFEYKEALCSFFSSSLLYSYTESSTIRDMLDYICKSAPFDPNYDYGIQGLRNRFILVANGEYKNFYNLEVKLVNMLDYISASNNIHLSVIIGYPGGGVGVGDYKGVHFYINSNESNHMGRAHVHAEYADNSASYDILSGTRICGYLPRKQDKLAQKAVSENRSFLLHEWNEFTNGFRISQEGYIYNTKQKKMEFLEL